MVERGVASGDLVIVAVVNLLHLLDDDLDTRTKCLLLPLQLFIAKLDVFVKCSSGGNAEVLQFQYYLFAVIIGIGAFMNRQA